MSRYDYDVVVIGAGPAGLAAATRVRWVKGYHALPGSVCLLDGAEPGGLLRWGSCVLTGPGWAYRGEDLAARLMEDVERFCIPIVSARATRIERVGAFLEVHRDLGDPLRCHAVVLATGFRPLTNEVDYYLRGVRITFKGYEHFPRLFAQCAEDAAGRGLVVIGNEKTAHLSALLDAVAEDAGGVRVVFDDLVRIEGRDRVEAIVVRGASRAGEAVEHRIECGAVLLDYNAFELSPSFGLDGLSLERDDRGFVRAGPDMSTSAPGIFAAGDVTGRYAATLVALGDGVNAGLSAYRYSFQRKFGHAPRLFAYAAADEALPEHPVDLPRWPDDAVPVRVGRSAPEEAGWVDGTLSLRDRARQQGTTTDEIRDTLARAIAARDVTAHHLAPRKA